MRMKRIVSAHVIGVGINYIAWNNAHARFMIKRGRGGGVYLCCVSLVWKFRELARTNLICLIPVSKFELIKNILLLIHALDWHSWFHAIGDRKHKFIRFGRIRFRNSSSWHPACVWAARTLCARVCNCVERQLSQCQRFFVRWILTGVFGQRVTVQCIRTTHITHAMCTRARSYSFGFVFIPFFDAHAQKPFVFSILTIGLYEKTLRRNE